MTKVDPRNLRVAEAVRLLNSTPLGEVVQPHVVYRHLNRAGYRIGDGRKPAAAKPTRISSDRLSWLLLKADIEREPSEQRLIDELLRQCDTDRD